MSFVVVHGLTEIFILYYSNFFITGIGSCEVRDLPLVDNARRIPVKGFRGSVVKIKCHSHFKLLGEHLAHCVDDKKWSLQEAPVCTRE